MGDKVRDGGRRCGQVRFRLTGPELLPWAKAPAVESFPAFPPDDHWPVMIAAYAQRGAG